MSDIERFDLLNKEESRKCVDEIISYFENERDEELGLSGAEEILEFMIQTIGPYTYNKGVEDARSAAHKGAEEVDFALNVLRKQ